MRKREAFFYKASVGGIDGRYNLHSDICTSYYCVYPSVWECYPQSTCLFFACLFRRSVKYDNFWDACFTVYVQASAVYFCGDNCGCFVRIDRKQLSDDNGSKPAVYTSICCDLQFRTWDRYRHWQRIFMADRDYRICIVYIITDHRIVGSTEIHRTQCTQRYYRKAEISWS